VTEEEKRKKGERHEACSMAALRESGECEA
jgi:hypothetical protein